MANISCDEPVGQLVAERPDRARVLERHGIDYCCHGRQTLETACQRADVDPATVLNELRTSDALPPPAEHDWTAAPLTDLADHIEQTYHASLKRELPRLAELLRRVVQAHADRHPELHILKDVFDAFRRELQEHMTKEEIVLFPICRSLERTHQPASLHCGSLRNPVSVMMLEHDHAGAALERMRQLTGGFTVPTDTCPTYTALVDGLRQLELDMHQHVHKENNILFPRAVALEQSLLGADNSGARVVR